jgi:hypothetical protein
MSTQVPDVPLTQIPGYSEVAAIVAGRPLHHFGGVVSFCYRQQTEAAVWPEIDLVMQEQEPPHEQIGFRFRGVRDVQFSGWGSIVGLYFQNIEDRGWEDARFEVGDYEQGGIHLFCHEILVYDPKRVA